MEVVQRDMEIPSGHRYIFGVTIVYLIFGGCIGVLVYGGISVNSRVVTKIVW